MTIRNLNIGIALAAVLIATVIAGVCLSSSGSSQAAQPAGQATQTTEQTAQTTAPAYRFVACQQTDSDWSATAAAFTAADDPGTEANDASQLASDLQQLSSQAGQANDGQEAYNYLGASQLFRGDAVELRLTGSVAADTGNWIATAEQQLQSDCGLAGGN
ncbi:MAG: hypothetical protein ABSG43_28085 [Solirubrobacteraceae bacterium]|jgi:hypothetical protein